MLKKIEREVATGPTGLLVSVLSTPSFRIVESEEDAVALSVRMPQQIKQRIEQYAKLGSTSQNFVARMLLEIGLDQLDEAIVVLSRQKEDEANAMFEEAAEEEKRKKQRQAEAFDALKNLRK